ncbi:enolase C-terminal domain-like protein [Mesorhizobium sp. M7A.F.Ca.US.006.01.1.1]|uniref:mandelate racemase/muconate lactonizing enzyme family protein n=1 Tax=Mesorhizobium sp. M7A.F.Ca.US.006.01.1.1 TaxID=2496707 RepID=UPI0013E2EA6C|nr:enolase C-terminal domain-like protein [Mesorhizobium sp. M7A.F.Ca.US.006.01.1.1]
MMIERIDVRVVEMPVRLKRVFSSGSYDTGPAGQLLGKPVFVRIYAGGVVGCGQIRPISPGHFVADTVHSVVAAIRDIYGPLLLGKRLTDMEAIDEVLTLRLAGNPAARAVLDIALHDALGKSLGLPVNALIGGCCQPVIPLEWSVSLADDVEVMIAEARRAVEDYGIKVLCLKAAGQGGWKRDVVNFEAVRKVVGDDIVIGVDPNTGWTVADTISAMREMSVFNLGYMEQPVLRRDVRGLGEIRVQAKGVPVMADESLFTVQDAAELASTRAVDVFCIKLYKVGGISPARKIAAIAEANGIPINCGGLAVASQFEAAASAHFCATIPVRRTFGAAEFVFGVGTMGADPLVADGAMSIVDGAVTVPTGPGLGLTLDEAQLERMTLQTTVVA